MYNAWQKLQSCVDQTWDMKLGQTTKDSIGQGLKQVLEKKSGVIRLHMMGKRVNFAARTVITPDPFINVDEIGLPEVFARKLSYPVPVTSWNVAELRKMVINGPNIHPGYVWIFLFCGTSIAFSYLFISVPILLKTKPVESKLFPPETLRSAKV